MLKIDKLTVEYKGKKVVDSFELNMDYGEVIGIVGESGSGKTSVIRAILGLLPAEGQISDGSIYFCGRELTKLGLSEMRKLRGTDISMIFQDCGSMINPIRRIGPQFTEYIRLHEKISVKSARMKALDMLNRMHLPDGKNILKSYPFQLSGGMRQRVGIAMSMTFSPKLLLADEPTSALDVTTQAQIVRQMLEMRKEVGTGIIIVTHNIGVAGYMADRLIVMCRGKIVEQGEREKILKYPENDYTKRLLASIPVLDGEPYV